MDEKLNNLLEFLLLTAKQLKEGAIEQLPPLAEEIVNWGFYSNLTIVALCLIILILSVFGLCKAFQHDAESWAGPVFVFTAVAIIVSTVFMLFSINPIVKTTVAPKLYLMEYVSDRLGGK